jgi:DNA-binding LacI/PurR family transcriptional regulator
LVFSGVIVALDGIPSVTTKRLPAGRRIAHELRAKIERKEYGTGEWLPTERELATEFDVDRSTIRAALTHLAEHNVIVRQPGRRPWVNLRALGEAEPPERAVPATKVQTIAAIIPQPPNYPAFPAIQRGILRVFRRSKSPFRLLVFDNQGENQAQCVALEQHALEAIENEEIAGAVLWQMGGAETITAIRRLHDKDIPIILLDRCPTDFPGDFIGVDNRAAAIDAVCYLVSLGHRRIAHLTTYEDALTVHERAEGYREALASAGLPDAPELVFRLEDGEALRPDTAPAADHFLSLADPPTAVFAMKDALAHLFIAEMQSRGRRVPEQISVMGFDDQDQYALLPASLTTVHQPFEKMGQYAAELLVRRLTLASAARSPYKHLMLPTPLVIRATCVPHGGNTDTGGVHPGKRGSIAQLSTR